MENSDKYIKYKIKYMKLLNQTGSARLAGNPTLTIPGLKREDFESYARPIDITNPYSRITRPNGSISAGQFALIKNDNERKVHDREPLHISPQYCNNIAYYPKKNIYDIRFVSYNVHNFVKQCDDDSKSINVNVNRVGETIRSGRNYDATIFTINNLLADIVFLQEIVPKFNTVNVPQDQSNAEFTTIINRFNKIGLSYYYIADTHYSKKKDALDHDVPYFILCNAIFSKYKILHSETCELGNNRICIYSLIEIDHIFICCFNIHLEWNLNIRDTKRNVPYTESQINKLAIYINNIKKEMDAIGADAFYILGGDFNNSLLDSRFNTLFSPLSSFMNKLKPVMSVIKDDKIHHINPQFSGAGRMNLFDGFYIIPENNYTIGQGRGMVRGNHTRKIINNYYNIVPENHSDHYPIVYDLIL